ncbi:hypothetical protein J537_2290 [Acinetobacter baumannii 1437282]|uniref:hypothetical protein n=1 Tax=Acinetobacter dispersus TaxID=70348 RepID=UPI00044DCD89|nr:hypothetical protein [Acinetobacter dispersus]EXB25994.1 hypothetical protein J537_2290 [Acinetobacter baumannii 1437282]QHH96678.1 hypothetical protein FPL17_03635 [Acinetobacter dispersus]
MNQIIKTSNSFEMVFIARNGKTREALFITENMHFIAKIVDSASKVIAECQVTVLDQSLSKGGVLIEVDKSITANWKAGTARTDIKLEIDGKVKSSNTYSFTIEKSIS